MNFSVEREVTSERLFFVRVRESGGERDYVTVLPPEAVSAHGLPRQAMVGSLADVPPQAGAPRARVFTPNPVFVRFLHDVLSKHVARQPGVIDEAARIGDGFVYVYDARTPDPSAGAVPREDIIGAVKVEAGKPVPDSYRANPDHQLLTSRGFVDLGEELHEALLREIDALRKAPDGGVA